MKIARMFFPVHSLGPGERAALWTQGCGKHCRGCVSPETHADIGRDIDENALAQLLIAASRGHRALTISGGDPFEQADGLLKLLTNIRGAFDDILIYTGFTLAELYGNETTERCLALTDVLIDGRYIDALNTPETGALRGSSNQQIHIFSDRLRDRYNEYIGRGRVLETFSHSGDLNITGII